MSKAAKLLTKEQKQTIVTAIKRVEKSTSAELRVHLEDKCKGDVLDRVVQVFDKLGMRKTKQRNGVLIYVAIESRKSAIIGDINVNACVHKEFWDECDASMRSLFASGDYVAGICSALTMLEQELKEHFPYQSDDVNELPDDISIG